jgi:hypothetical protein
MPQSLDNHQGRGTAANAAAAVDASATSLDNEGSSSNGGSATTCLLPKTAKAKRDAKLVRRARATVMTVLLVSAVVVAALAYGTLKANEYDSFVNQVCATYMLM